MTYSKGQKIKVQFTNEFHNTTANGIAEIIDAQFMIDETTSTMKRNYIARIWHVNWKQIEKRLCGIKECQCGGIRGPITVYKTGQKVQVRQGPNDRTYPMILSFMEEE